MTRIARTSLFLLALAGIVAGAEFRAGTARIRITSTASIRLAGYNRDAPSSGVHDELWAKALAIQDSRGASTLIVTTDLIGLPGSLTDAVAAELGKRHKLPRSRVLFNSSHTHTGPVVWGNLLALFAVEPAEEAPVREYTRELQQKLVTVAEAALADLSPARVFFGRGTAGFAANRRVLTPKRVRFGVNQDGPVDHDVPVLLVRSRERVKAVLFGYACHLTTVGPARAISADYAGAAQAELEETYPGALALFLQLCGGDQNPYPRGSWRFVSEHGAALAAEVGRVLGASMREVHGPSGASLEFAKPKFQPHTREMFERELKEKQGALARRAAAMLRAYHSGAPVTEISYPVQVLRFGRDLTIVALGGEVVVDYALRIKKELPAGATVVAAYSNDVMCYVPSARILREGGYEAADNMALFGQPGPFDQSVEQTIMQAVGAAIKAAGKVVPRSGR